MNIINPETGSKLMNKNILIVLGGAVLAAILVAMLVQVTMRGKSSEDVSSVQVLVAAKDLRIGHELEEGDLTWKDWSEDSLFKGAIIKKEGQDDADKILEGRIERNFSRGEAVVRSALLKTSGNNVVARLSEGERAISVKVSSEDLVAGFISPGQFVDIILTYDVKLSFGDKQSSRNQDNSEVMDMMALNLTRMAAETILQNVRVLAIDQNADIEPEKDDKKAKKIAKKVTVTVAVPVRDAEKLALAAEMGRITLAMRGVGDSQENVKTPVMSDARLTTLDDEIYAEYMRIKNGGDEGSTSSSGAIKVYSGAQMKEVKLP